MRSSAHGTWVLRYLLLRYLLYHIATPSEESTRLRTYTYLERKTGGGWQDGKHASASPPNVRLYKGPRPEQHISPRNSEASSSFLIYPVPSPSPSTQILSVMLVPLLQLPAPETRQLALGSILQYTMAPATNILLDFYGQTIENCRFMSHEDAEIAIITSMDPATGKFRATVVRTEGYGRRKKRTVIVSEVGTSLVDAIELLHTKSAEAVQNHVTTIGYDVVPRKKDPKRHKHKSSAGDRWDDSATSSSSNSDDSEASASDSDASDISQSTSRLPETGLSDDGTVFVSRTTNSKKKKASAVKPNAVRPGPPPPMPAWPSQNRVGRPPPPPGFLGFPGRGPVPPHGVLPGRAPPVGDSVTPHPMPPRPPMPKAMPPMSSAATVPSPPAPPIVSATTASAAGPSGVAANAARPPAPFPPMPRPMSMPPAARPPAPARASTEVERDAVVNIKWAGHDGSATIFVCCSLSKQVIGLQAMRYVITHPDEFGPDRSRMQNHGLICLFRSVVLPVQSPKPGGSSEKAYGLERYEKDDMSTLCNSVSPISAVPRFDVTVVGKIASPGPAAASQAANVSSPSPPPPPPGWWGDANKQWQTGRPKPAHGEDSATEED
ncbi:hypothetical protein RB599_009934 [Gaeumannomyces hyphopodioides]